MIYVPESDGVFLITAYELKRKAVECLQAPHAEEEQMSREQRFPPGWDEERVRRVLEHYDQQSEFEAVAEDEAAFEDSKETVMEVPAHLVPKVRELLAKHTK